MYIFFFVLKLKVYYGIDLLVLRGLIIRVVGILFFYEEFFIGMIFLFSEKIKIVEFNLEKVFTLKKLVNDFYY